MQNRIIQGVPSNAAPGQRMVVMVASDEAITRPVAWNSLRTGLISGMYYDLSWIQVTPQIRGTDVQWNFAHPTNVWGLLWFLADGITGIDAITFNEITAATVFTAKSVTSTSNNGMILAYFLAKGVTNIRPVVPAGLTATDDMGSLGHIISLEFIAFTQATLGATGDINAILLSGQPTDGVAVMAAVSGSNLASVSGGLSAS